MITVTAKTVDEAVTKALIELQTTSDKLEYEVVDKGSTGFLGIGSKPAIIRAKKKESIEDKAMDFLSQIFWAMNMEAVSYTHLDVYKRQVYGNSLGFVFFQVHVNAVRHIVLPDL